MNLSQVTASKLPPLIWQTVQSTDVAGLKWQGKVLAFNGPSLLGTTYSLNQLCPSTMTFSLNISIFKRLHSVRDIYKGFCLNGSKYRFVRNINQVSCAEQVEFVMFCHNHKHNWNMLKLISFHLYHPHTEIKRLFFPLEDRVDVLFLSGPSQTNTSLSSRCTDPVSLATYHSDLISNFVNIYLRI